MLHKFFKYYFTILAGTILLTACNKEVSDGNNFSLYNNDVRNDTSWSSSVITSGAIQRILDSTAVYNHKDTLMGTNAKTIEFLLSRKTGIKDYSFTVELKKIHKDGSVVPMEAKIGILTVDENGGVDYIIGRFRINRNIHFGIVMRYDVHGPDKEEFEKVINKAVQKFLTISGKEKEALSYVAKGYSFKEIADKLGVSASAIEKRIQPLYKRFNVKNLAHLVSFAYENHILP